MRRTGKSYEVGNLKVLIFPTNDIEWTGFIIDKQTHSILQSYNSFSLESIITKIDKEVKKR